MIRNVQELGQAVEQMGRMYRALASLRAEELPRSPGGFALMAEGPLDEIRQLREEIDAYAGVCDAQANAVDLWMRLEGPRLAWPDVPVSVLAAYLDSFRKGIRTVAEILVPGKLETAARSSLRRLCDFRVTALETGSLRVGLRIPDEESPEYLGARPVRAAVKEYVEVAAWAGSEALVETLDEKITDARRRRVLLDAVGHLAPPARGWVTSVELTGRAVGNSSPVRLTRSSKERIRAALATMAGSREETNEGIIREVDLDKRSFILRDGENEVFCSFDPELTESVKQGLDRRVIVRGERRLRPGRSAHGRLEVRELSLAMG